MGRLDGRIAVVTGGGRGIGRAVSLAFAKEGAKIVVNEKVNDPAAQGVVERIREMGQKAFVAGGDVAARADVDRIMQAALDHFGKIDILVNNAGTTRPAMLHKMTEEQWDEVVDVNLKGPFLCIQAASRSMIREGKGKIINVTSVAGLMGTKGQINYSSAKGGIIALTRSAARELGGHGILVNAVCLGIVNTAMTEKIRTDPGLKEIYQGRILLNRFAEPDEVVPAFIFFASDESNYITGQVLCVDGGYGMT